MHDPLRQNLDLESLAPVDTSVQGSCLLEKKKNLNMNRSSIELEHDYVNCNTGSLADSQTGLLIAGEKISKERTSNRWNLPSLNTKSTKNNQANQNGASGISQHSNLAKRRQSQITTGNLSRKTSIFGHLETTQEQKNLQDFALRRAKLKAVNRTSALLAGFAMVAMVEVQIDSGIEYPTILLVIFSCTTTLLVVVHLISLMISTCLLPNMEVQNQFKKDSIYLSPDNAFRSHIEVAWILSTGLGLVLMLVEIGLLIILKFYGVNNNSTTTYNWVVIVSCGVFLFPATVVFIFFAMQYYRQLLLGRFKKNIDKLDQAERLLEISGSDQEEGVSRGRKLPPIEILKSISLSKNHHLNRNHNSHAATNASFFLKEENEEDENNNTNTKHTKEVITSSNGGQRKKKSKEKSCVSNSNSASTCKNATFTHLLHTEMGNVTTQTAQTSERATKVYLPKSTSKRNSSLKYGATQRTSQTVSQGVFGIECNSLPSHNQSTSGQNSVLNTTTTQNDISNGNSQARSQVTYTCSSSIPATQLKTKSTSNTSAAASSVPLVGSNTKTLSLGLDKNTSARQSSAMSSLLFTDKYTTTDSNLSSINATIEMAKQFALKQKRRYFSSDNCNDQGKTLTTHSNGTNGSGSDSNYGHTQTNIQISHEIIPEQQPTRKAIHREEYEYQHTHEHEISLENMTASNQFYQDSEIGENQTNFVDDDHNIDANGHHHHHPRAKSLSTNYTFEHSYQNFTKGLSHLVVDRTKLDGHGSEISYDEPQFSDQHHHDHDEYDPTCRLNINHHSSNHQLHPNGLGTRLVSNVSSTNSRSRKNTEDEDEEPTQITVKEFTCGAILQPIDNEDHEGGEDQELVLDDHTQIEEVNLEEPASNGSNSTDENIGDPYQGVSPQNNVENTSTRPQMQFENPNFQEFLNSGNMSPILEQSNSISKSNSHSHSYRSSSANSCTSGTSNSQKSSSKKADLEKASDEIEFLSRSNDLTLLSSDKKLLENSNDSLSSMKDDEGENKEGEEDEHEIFGDDFCQV